MRQHNGMRPQDIVVLVKMVLWENREWQFQELARALYISPAEVSESVNRSSFAGLVNHQRKKVHRLSFLEFLQFGMPYVFPQAPGPLTRGMITGHSHPYFNKGIISSELYVWPEVNGIDYGQAIEPFYAKQVKAAREDERLYEILAVLDVIRTGKSREKKMAIEYLHEFFKHESSSTYYENHGRL
ncbi:MAG: hypothetical protein ACN4EP_11030 [Sediminibacterium sp.]